MGRLACLIGLAAALVVSCAPFAQPPVPPLPPEDGVAGAPGPTVVARLIAKAGTPRTSDLLQGNTRFALDLYNRLRAEEGTLFFSPFSLSSALVMTSAGASGKTLEQMTRTLHLPPQEEAHRAMAHVMRQINGRQSRQIELKTANALWGEKSVRFRADYLQRMRNFYDAGLQQVDFSRAPDSARQTINAWVERQTHDRIKDLLAPGMVSPVTRLVLTNAVYFKGDWQTPFSKSSSCEEPFTLVGGDKVQTMMMHQMQTYAYHEEPDLQVLELRYAGGELSMVVALPRKPDGLAALEKKLTVEELARWLKQLSEQEVEVTLPKFKMTRAFQVAQTLAALGMSDAFTETADFTGMTERKEKVLISAVIHKAFIDVTEEGTQAAAATAVCCPGMAAPGFAPPPKPVFRADHPFLFLIRDCQTESILFLGRLVDPRS